MLIDFSDVVQTNVFVLGQAVLKFCKLLNMQLPLIDPSLYIQVEFEFIINDPL
jgi:transcription factor IIIB subunit 2